MPCKYSDCSYQQNNLNTYNISDTAIVLKCHVSIQIVLLVRIAKSQVPSRHKAQGGTGRLGVETVTALEVAGVIGDRNSRKGVLHQDAEVIGEGQPGSGGIRHIPENAIVALRNDQVAGVVRTGPFISSSRAPGAAAVVITQRQPRGVAE